MKLLNIAIFSLAAIPVILTQGVSAQTSNPCGTLSGTPLYACEKVNPPKTCTTVYKPDPTACKNVPYPYYDACMRSAPVIAVKVCK